MGTCHGEEACKVLDLRPAAPTYEDLAQRLGEVCNLLQNLAQDVAAAKTKDARARIARTMDSEAKDARLLAVLARHGVRP